MKTYWLYCTAVHELGNQPTYSCMMEPAWQSSYSCCYMPLFALYLASTAAYGQWNDLGLWASCHTLYCRPVILSEQTAYAYIVFIAWEANLEVLLWSSEADTDPQMTYNVCIHTMLNTRVHTLCVWHTCCAHMCAHTHTHTHTLLHTHIHTCGMHVIHIHTGTKWAGHIIFVWDDSICYWVQACTCIRWAVAHAFSITGQLSLYVPSQYETRSWISQL